MPNSASNERKPIKPTAEQQSGGALVKRRSLRCQLLRRHVEVFIRNSNGWRHAYCRRCKADLCAPLSSEQRRMVTSPKPGGSGRT